MKPKQLHSTQPARLQKRLASFPIFLSKAGSFECSKMWPFPGGALNVCAISRRAWFMDIMEDESKWALPSKEGCSCGE